MAEVEHVALRLAAFVEDAAHLGLDRGPVGEQHGRIEVALHRAARAPGRPDSGTRQSTPRTSAPASAIAPSSSPVPTPKWIRGTPASATAPSTRAECGSTNRR